MSVDPTTARELAAEHLLAAQQSMQILLLAEVHAAGNNADAGAGQRIGHLQATTAVLGALNLGPS